MPFASTQLMKDDDIFANGILKYFSLSFDAQG